MFDRKRILSVSALLLAIAAAITLVSAEASPGLADSDCASSKTNDGCNVIQGFRGNSAAENVIGATIGGGGNAAFLNRVDRNYGTIGGGLDNFAGEHATVGGGAQNRAIAFRSTIAGGFSNTTTKESATIGGGYGNIASGIESVVGGGIDNTAGAWDSTVGGGSGNIASYHLATVAGGSYNIASSLNAFIGGGDTNTAEGYYSTIAGGSGNLAHGPISTISGGTGNKATGEYTFIGGGLGNQATGKNSVIVGGYGNIAGGQKDDLVSDASIGGGLHNIASGNLSTVPGGTLNRAGADYSFAAGRRAIVDALHHGAFLFADSSDADFKSLAANEFAARAIGGVRFVTAIDSVGNPTAGVRLAKGGGSWEALSDRGSKTNIEPVNGQTLLAELANMPINTWSYRTEDPSIRHIGPMAQDFRIFGTGINDKYINMMDANGVALAAIQELDRQVQEKDAKLAAQEQTIASLQAQVSSLDSRLVAIEQRTAFSRVPASNQDNRDWLVFAGAAVAGLVYVQRSRTR